MCYRDDNYFTVNNFVEDRIGERRHQNPLSSTVFRYGPQKRRNRYVSHDLIDLYKKSLSETLSLGVKILGCLNNLVASVRIVPNSHLLASRSRASLITTSCSINSTSP